MWSDLKSNSPGKSPQGTSLLAAAAKLDNIQIPNKNSEAAETHKKSKTANIEIKTKQEMNFVNQMQKENITVNRESKLTVEKLFDQVNKSPTDGDQFLAMMKSLEVSEQNTGGARKSPKSPSQDVEVSICNHV